MTETVEVGRRERKKRATRRALKRAALRLALERGVEHLTVEEISEAADVAPRTFFNYFACKEDALVGESMEAAAELREMIAARPVDEPPLRTLRAVLEEIAGEHTAPEHREEVLARQRLIRENPALLPRQLAHYAGFERLLCEAVAERLGVDPEQDPRPVLLAAFAVTVVRVAMHRWTCQGERSVAALIDEGFDLLERGL